MISSKPDDDPTFKKNHEAWKFFEGKDASITATGSIQDVNLVQCYRITKMPQSGSVLLVLVQTQALPEKASHKVQGMMEKREWKVQLQFLIYSHIYAVSHTFVMVNGKITYAWLIT